ncbi:hypothetical protein CLAFUW4_01102 [Fulvia fulva]|uniref:BHLH domain-containing protein n=1 Tax=Passalora fulva TaxID=5499 RepID=A0A9Q8P3M2_PASFU|nr:uncharacterized protein CLAFUR5_01107 [Fulvia fulva]KAK4634935.1 hypothetical protein CLAFUR4_01103 [Fulvia fulva]KAK4637725.1 hypothetical protein CLAFUR0_01104 [Fulvia fulva]UJO11954.1 hypothetical protein CLAFUR5_01107 [Fulvia fulva]WPV09919.1 hypothetical protein CLAFUW4_01102 [Fulvia fulva]WPV24301.1 hypothetical protein CLAFUW7_01107 [Fulvia fulva]
MYTDASTLSMDAHLFPSTFGNSDYMHPDGSNGDFLFSHHGVWNPEATFNPGVYYGDMSGYGPMMVYDAPMQCSLNVAPSFQIDTLPVAEQRPIGSSGQKRKSRSSTKPVVQKRQKQSNSQRSSVSSSSSPKSIVSDSIAPTAPSCRAHYAVEKRYRTTLNDRYAALARLVSQTETQEICRTENKDWEVPPKLDSSPSSGDDKGPCKRQSKTTTLSAAIDTIALLDRCCMRKAQELQSLREQYRALSAAGN